MAQNRDNCIILLVDPPETEKISQEFKTAFGPERAAHINSDLLSSAYRLAKGFSDAILLLSYQKTPHHPDLTWLDPEDPGFLDVKSAAIETRIQDAFRLAFFTGAKKAVLINHTAPEIKPDWLSLAFEAVGEKTAAIGASQDGSFYLLGLTQQNLKLLEAPGFYQEKSAETLADRAKKNKLTIFSTPETYTINSEETLLKWMEARETLPPLFQGTEEAGDAAEHGGRKHYRHRARRQEPQGQPPAEKPPL